MYVDISKPPKAMPKAQPKTIQLGITLLPPLSHRGHGPGLILLVPDSNSQLTITDGVPSAIIKWAEEGYTVVTLQASALKAESPASILGQSVAALTSCKQCDTKDKIGLVGKHPLVMLEYKHRLLTVQS
jgi:carboxymethylenebutenolidase